MKHTTHNILHNYTNTVHNQVSGVCYVGMRNVVCSPVDAFDFIDVDSKKPKTIKKAIDKAATYALAGICEKKYGEERKCACTWEAVVLSTMILPEKGKKSVKLDDYGKWTLEQYMLIYHTWQVAMSKRYDERPFEVVCSEVFKAVKSLNVAAPKKHIRTTAAINIPVKLLLREYKNTFDFELMYFSYYLRACSENGYVYATSYRKLASKLKIDERKLRKFMAVGDKFRKFSVIKKNGLIALKVNKRQEIVFKYAARLDVKDFRRNKNNWEEGNIKPTFTSFIKLVRKAILKLHIATSDKMVEVCTEKRNIIKSFNQTDYDAIDQLLSDPKACGVEKLTEELRNRHLLLSATRTKGLFFIPTQRKSYINLAQKISGTSAMVRPLVEELKEEGIIDVKGGNRTTYYYSELCAARFMYDYALENYKTGSISQSEVLSAYVELVKAEAQSSFIVSVDGKTNKKYAMVAQSNLYRLTNDNSDNSLPIRFRFLIGRKQLAHKCKDVRSAIKYNTHKWWRKCGNRYRAMRRAAKKLHPLFWSDGMKLLQFGYNIHQIDKCFDLGVIGDAVKHPEEAEMFYLR